MNTAETVTAEIMLGLIILAALLIAASAHEWINFTGSASVKAVPAAKRKPRTAIEVRTVLPDAEGPGGAVESIAAARRMG